MHSVTTLCKVWERSYENPGCDVDGAWTHWIPRVIPPLLGKPGRGEFSCAQIAAFGACVAD